VRPEGAGSTPARLIVDGMNVIGSRPDGWWRDRRAAVAALVEALEAVAATGEEVTVMFDGPPFDIGAPGVEVLFASRSGPDAADDDIVSLVEAAPEARDLRVVTSDDALAERVRCFGAGVIGAGTFRRRLDTLQGPGE
jgi:predicted RNA-binding protein with PIN domain